MKRLIFILFIFSFATITLAEDVKDFEIEGISIGDSLLDYFTKKEIKDTIKRERKADRGSGGGFYQIRHTTSANGDPLKIYDEFWTIFKIYIH